MKIYEIIDEGDPSPLGVLLYYKKSKTFIVELREALDEWTAPLHFTRQVREGIYTMPRTLSRMWARARIIPPDRQNIGDILKNSGMKEYDEMRLLELSSGRCSQDFMHIRKTSHLPDYVKARNQKNLVDCTLTDKGYIICFFNNGIVKKVRPEDIADYPDMDKVISNKKLYRSGSVGVGGYYITFNDSIDIPAYILYNAGEEIPVGLDDFLAFAGNNLLDTSESCRVCNCSRQNLSNMLKNEFLAPVKENVKGNLYLKGEVLKNTW